MADAASEAAGAKRKRGITERTSPDTRRSKRSGGPASDAQTAALIQSAVNAVDAVSHAEMNNVNPADFVALQKAAADHTSDHETSPDAAAASSTAAAALGTMYPNLHVGPPAEESFSQDNEPADTSYNPEVTQQQPAAETSTISIPQPNGMPAPPAYNIKPKPVVGSQEWHKLRKDNHKEVERRRRETINEGINELAKLVPNCDKNKGSILQRAVQYITQLKEEESGNLEKWTLEKLLTEQAIGELSSTNDRLKQDLDRAYKELEIWKKLATNAGLKPSPEELASVS